MFLCCGVRLVGIIGYRLTVSLPTQPTSPKIGFFFESEYFGRVFGTSYCPRMRRPTGHSDRHIYEHNAVLAVRQFSAPVAPGRDQSSP